MLLGALMDGLAVRVQGGPAGTPFPAALAGLRICDINEDSRTVVPGSLFIARSGTKSDGKQFANDAVKAGAVAVLTDDDALRLESPRTPVLVAQDVQLATALLAERFYGNPSSLMHLVGVTGTNGKTTTTSLVWQLLNDAGTRCGLIGTVVVDDGTEVAPASMTTPPAIEVSRSLARMQEAGCAAASLEVSSHALHQKRADALRFRVGVFTNLTGDHLDYHRTMDEYASAKARLFEILPPDGLALVNAQDPAAPRMARDCRARVLTCSVGDHGPAAACRATVVDESIDGMSLTLQGPWGAIAARVPLIGRYNAMNILQAVASAHELGLPKERLEAGLQRLKAPPGRLERVTAPGDKLQVFVDYAHSDDSLHNVLTAVAQALPGRAHQGGRVGSAAGAPRAAPAGGRLIAVFGCGGNRDTTKRPRMGRVAAEDADLVIVTSDNPRTERPSDIVDQVLAGVPAAHRHKVSVQVDRAKAIRAAIEAARPGDVVIIAGKGHETEQIQPDGSGGTIRTHFDDREVARTVLEDLFPRPAVQAPARPPEVVVRKRGTQD
ncbi:MAG: UDP-N-acetylmuramoyl-L-alanyl-D-glutamate--2,6-diaminopimelate ligase [Phycisphaerales bacterium]